MIVRTLAVRTLSNEITFLIHKLSRLSTWENSIGSVTEPLVKSYSREGIFLVHEVSQELAEFSLEPT